MKNLNKINRNKITVLLLAIVTLAGSCKTKFYEEPASGPATAGSVNFSKYTAVGSSITAGFADNALFDEGQENAYPNLIAKRIREVNSSLDFNQPDVNTNTGWSSGTLGRFQLAYPVGGCVGVSIGGVGQSSGGLTAVPVYAGNKATLNNLAVPFIRITSINAANVGAATTASNTPYPYFNNVTASGTLGISSEARIRQGTFFTAWIGYVDALRFATSGGTTAMVTPANFKIEIEKLLDSLLAKSGSKGVIGNIPYVDQFAVVFNNNRRLTSSTDPARNPAWLNTNQVNAYNLALGSTVFKGTGAGVHPNYFAIKTSATYSTGAIRQLDVTKDFIVRANVLDSVGIGQRDSLAVRTCTPNTQQRELRGLTTPIADNAVLDADEIAYMRGIIDQYNDIIRQAVDSRNAGGKRVGIVDLNSFYTTLNDPLYGIHYGPSVVHGNHANLGPDFGGFYSLDRIHPTPKGQALLANEFIKATNATFGSTLKTYDPADFRGNLIPTY